MGIRSTLNRVRSAGYRVQAVSRDKFLVRGGIRTLVYFPRSPSPNVWPAGSRGGYVFRDGENHAEVMIRFLETGEFPIRFRRVGNMERDEKRELKEKLYRRSPVCRWCRKPLGIDEATIEHVIPLACGGSHRIGNLVLACWKCNHERGCRAVKGGCDEADSVEG
jgi:hypothetical protein